MATNRSWRLDRASVHRGEARPQSNQDSNSDSHVRPHPGSRDRVWLGGSTRLAGTVVAGYDRIIGQ